MFSGKVFVTGIFLVFLINLAIFIHGMDLFHRDGSVTTKRGIVKILHFRQFYKHFVFVEDSDGGRKKTLKNYADVNVCIDMVCGDSKIDFERED